MSASITFPVSRDFDVSESGAGVGLGTVTLNHLDLDVSVPEVAAQSRLATEDERTLANQGYVTLHAIVSAARIADILPISRQQKRFIKEPSRNPSLALSSWRLPRSR